MTQVCATSASCRGSCFNMLAQRSAEKCKGSGTSCRLMMMWLQSMLALASSVFLGHVGRSHTFLCERVCSSSCTVLVSVVLMTIVLIVALPRALPAAPFKFSVCDSDDHADRCAILCVHCAFVAMRFPHEETGECRRGRGGKSWVYLPAPREHKKLPSTLWGSISAL